MMLNDEESNIYRVHFQSAGMSVPDFKMLMAHGIVSRATERVELICDGEAADLVLILDGQAEVVVGNAAGGSHGTPTASTQCEHVLLNKASLIGEVSFLTGGQASAKVFALPGCQFIVWKKDELHRVMDRKPTLQNSLELKIGRELTRKLRQKIWRGENLMKELGSIS